MAIARGRWTARSAARRLVEVAREEDARTVWLKLLGETVYRRLAIFELGLAGPPPSYPAPPGSTSDRLDADGLDDYLALRPEATREEVIERLSRGDVCFVSRLDGRMVASSWEARGRMWSSYLEREIALAGDESCSYETFTDPSARGLGVGPVQRAVMIDHLRKAGCRRLLATIVPENRRGIRLVEKLGYRRIGVIGYVALGPWRRDFCRMRDGAVPPGGIGSE